MYIKPDVKQYIRRRSGRAILVSPCNGVLLYLIRSMFLAKRIIATFRNLRVTFCHVYSLCIIEDNFMIETI